MSQIQKYKFWNIKFNKFVGPEEYLVDSRLNVFFLEHGPEGDKLINSNGFIRVLENTNFKDKNGSYIFEGDEIVDNDGTLGRVAWSDNAICFDQIQNEGVEVNGFYNKSGWSVTFQDLKHHPILLQKDTASLLSIKK